MDSSIYTDKAVDVLKKHIRKKRSQEDRPILIFPCGGNGKDCKARDELRSAIENSEDVRLRNTILLSAENIAKTPVLSSLNLLEQEALISDIADIILIFCESVGSFIELGAFTVLKSSTEITTVVIDSKYRNSESFLNNGPVKLIAGNKQPLSKVFYANLKCPLGSIELNYFIRSLRDAVKEYENRLWHRTKSQGTKKKAISNDGQKVDVGSFAHEMFDLISLLGPIDEKTLIELYLMLKGFSQSDFKLHSNTLSELPSNKNSILPRQVLAIMEAIGMIDEICINDQPLPLFVAAYPPVSFFMFKGTKEKDFAEMRYLIHKRKKDRGLLSEGGFYNR